MWETRRSLTMENDSYSTSLRLLLPQALDSGPQALELIVVVVELASIVLLWTAISKAKHTYGWSSASGGKCKAIKVGYGFAAVNILMLVKF
jgi:hypothetical protein